MTAELVGEKELANLFRKIVNEVDKSEMENRLMKVARKLRNKIKDAAPEGPTGNLKEGIVAKRYKKSNRVMNSPAVYVRIDEKKAPHAHLVERGTRGLRYPTEKAKKVKNAGGWLAVIDGNPVWVKHTGQMPANPFFQRTVDHSGSQVVSDIGKEVVDLVKKVWK